MTKSGTVLVSGGAGFISSHVADRYLTKRHAVTILDNLERAGADANLTWLKERHSNRFEVLEADITQQNDAVQKAVSGTSVVHLAAQVAVEWVQENHKLVESAVL